jgi:hypothetical protein
MVPYRCYLLDGAGAIRGVEIVRGIDDRQAIDEARELLAGRREYHGFELWRHDRRVCTEARELT